MDRKLPDQNEWSTSNSSASAPQQQQQQQHSSSPSSMRLPVTPPSASLLGTSTSASTPYQSRPPQYSTQHTTPSLSPVHIRPLPPIQPYTTPPNRQQPLPPMHTHPHSHPHPIAPYHPAHIPPPHNAPPTPGETVWDLRQIDVYRLDEGTLRNKLVDAVHHIQYLSTALSSTKTSLAQASLQNTLLRSESREISQRSAVETELAKREVEVLLREYAAQMPSANQLANTYYRRYRGLKRRVKDLEGLIESKDTEIKRLQEYVRESGISVPREGNKRTRRTGLKYAPRGGPWAAVNKTKPPSIPRTLKPAPSTLSQAAAAKKSDAGTSQESQSSGLDALGMLASQVLDSQGSQSQSQQRYSAPKQPALLSPLPLPKRRRRGSESTDHDDPGLTEEEDRSPVLLKEEDEPVRESPPASQIREIIPIPYRAALMNGGNGIGPPRRVLNFDAKDSELLNHDGNNV